MIVMKFGGSSLANPEKIHRCIEIVRREIARTPVVVVSAHGRTTDSLISAARKAHEGRVDMEEIERYHFELADSLGVDRRMIEPLVFKLQSMLHGISLLKELTPRTLDHVMSFGERMSALMVAATMSSEGMPAVAHCAYDIGLLTDSNFGQANPLADIEAEISRRLNPAGLLPVVTGFIAKDRRDNITTLGRNGSNFTASVIGAALGAEEVQIWTDVDGIMTADPSIEPGAKNLPALSFDEASELAYYGAEVLHPGSLIPAMKKGVPVRIANSNKPGESGTVITPRSSLTSRMAKSVVYKEDVCLLNFASERIMSAVELLDFALTTLSSQGVKVHMAATSEASVSLVTDRAYSPEQVEPAFAKLREFGRASLERDRAIVCVVGEELRGRPEVLGRVFDALGAAGVKAQMVSQSASQINVAFLVNNSEIPAAVKSLHGLLMGK
jgi:aspartate kinase